MSERNQEKSLVATWNDTMNSWQIAVQETLNAQARWLREWTGRVHVTSGSPTELRKNVQQAQVLLLRWTEAQQQLWQDWFHLVQQLELVPETDTQTNDGLIQTLRESGQAIVNAQAEWVQRWLADLPGG